MKRVILAAAIAVLLSTGWAAAVEKPSAAEFCTKHCTAVELRKEVKALERAVEADRSVTGRSSADKLATLIAQKERTKRHLAQHESELASLRAELGAAEAELSKIEGK